MKVGVCVTGEIRSFATHHTRELLLNSILDLPNVSFVNFDLVKNTTCLNGLRLYKKNLCVKQKRYTELLDIHTIKKDIRNKIKSFSLNIEEVSNCNSFNNSRCCAFNKTVPMGYFQYLRSDRCVRKLFRNENVSHVVRLRPDVLCDTKKIDFNKSCIRHMAHSNLQGDLLVVSSKSWMPFSGSLEYMERACVTNKRTLFPEFTLNCSSVNRNINCNILR